MALGLRCYGHNTLLKARYTIDVDVILIYLGPVFRRGIKLIGIFVSIRMVKEMLPPYSPTIHQELSSLISYSRTSNKASSKALAYKSQLCADSFIHLISAVK